MKKHNHATRDIKPFGKCPACDEYHDRNIPKKTMAEIRDAEADKYQADDSRVKIGPANSFKAGFDCRDKMDNEALRLAVEALEYFKGSEFNFKADDALVEIRKIQEQQNE